MLNFCYNSTQHSLEQDSSEEEMEQTGGIIRVSNCYSNTYNLKVELSVIIHFLKELTMSDLQSPTISNPGVLIPVNPAIEDYMRGLLNHTDHPVLIEMEMLAQKNNFPIVGRLVGVFLETMAKMISAQRVFEFGSGYGYSAYWFAKAVGSTGQVICSEADILNIEKAERYLVRPIYGTGLISARVWLRIFLPRLTGYLTFVITMSTRVIIRKSG